MGIHRRYFAESGRVSLRLAGRFHPGRARSCCTTGTGTSSRSGPTELPLFVSPAVHGTGGVQHLSLPWTTDRLGLRVTPRFRGGLVVGSEVGQGVPHVAVFCSAKEMEQRRWVASQAGMALLRCDGSPSHSRVAFSPPRNRRGSPSTSIRRSVRILAWPAAKLQLDPASLRSRGAPTRPPWRRSPARPRHAGRRPPGRRW